MKIATHYGAFVIREDVIPGDNQNIKQQLANASANFRARWFEP
jgi:hypothetical protein